MKKIIYTALIVGLVSVGVVTANNLITTDHTHAATSSKVIDHSGPTNADESLNDHTKGPYLSVDVVTANNPIATDHTHPATSSKVIDHSGPTNADESLNDHTKGPYPYH